MAERHDKEMYKSVTVRFSYVDEDHGDLIGKMSEECERRHISKNKLILECIKEHYTKEQSEYSQQLENMMLDFKDSMNKELQKVKDDMRKEFYQDVIRVLTIEFLANRKPGETMELKEVVVETKEKQEEFDPSTDENMMANIMKWS